MHRDEAVRSESESAQPAARPLVIGFLGINRQLAFVAGKRDEAPRHVVAAVALAVLGRGDRDQRLGPAAKANRVAAAHKYRLDLLRLGLKASGKADQQMGRT